jgi:hypothetical protein
VSLIPVLLGGGNAESIGSQILLRPVITGFTVEQKCSPRFRDSAAT